MVSESNKYAILSHRWLPEDEQEVRYADIVNCKDDLRSKPGWTKLEWCRRQATADGLFHVWAGTACIDKSNSQELTESINSMYKWYKEAEVCYVYLQDMPDPESGALGSDLVTPEAEIVDTTATDQSLPLDAAVEDDHKSPVWDTWSRDAFGKCSWFTRAWTLQEMIAPHRIRFYSQSWRFICNLEDIIADIAELTGVHESLWTQQRPLASFSYSLLGLMGVSIPVVYGEGTNAFQRLQDEILRSGSDDSIFAFNVIGTNRKMGPFETTCLLARSPADFQECGNVICYNEHVSTPMILRCGLEHEPETILVLRLRSVGFQRSDLYAVVVSGQGARLETCLLDVHGYDSCPLKTFSVLRDPTPDGFRSNAANSKAVTIMCHGMCDIELKKESVQGTWNARRRCFVLPREQNGNLPYFDAELEIQLAGSGSRIKAHIELWPGVLRGVLRLRFHKAMFLPAWTTLASGRGTYYCTFTRHNGGLLVGRAFTYKRPVRRKDIMFLEFEHMQWYLVLLHACRRIDLCFACCFVYMLFIVAVGVLAMPILAMDGHMNTIMIWLLFPISIWFLTVGILHHFNKISLKILLAVPFGILGALSVIAILWTLICTPLSFMPPDIPYDLEREVERFEALRDHPNWARQGWTRKAKAYIKTFATGLWLIIKCTTITSSTSPMLLPNLHRINIDPLLGPPLLLLNFNIIPTHLPLPHDPLIIKRPILQAIAPLPLHPIILILILIPKLHRNTIFCKSEQFLSKLVVFHFSPFGCEEGDDLVCAAEESVAVSPDGVGGVGLRDFGGVLGVPEVLGGFDFVVGG
ncbi:hypothetical protein CBER1_09686 [Cercospora berteroae]|uniref:Heterokaryon incompatibility domain-containing protein n=1 Tax=Cercospora berteroae TaxID=357750 RepID=A0A2S6BWU6_9PEZI|nr:hypothetical protein CBER1_09686 [Cercospora berteroae]